MRQLKLMAPRSCPAKRIPNYIRPAGLDVTEGKVILVIGTWLSARAIALAVSAGHVSAEVWDQPRIGISSTGDELG